MICFIVALSFLFFQDVVPFKPTEEFEVKLDYDFKARPTPDNNTVQLGNQGGPYGTGVLPYLILRIKMLALPEERTRVRISNNLSARPVSRKVSENSVLELDLGFTVDMIDRVKPHQYTVTFTDAAKQAVNCIVINVDEDGSFFINGEKRGRF